MKIDKVQTKERAFVNAGGILTKELNPKTMEVKEKKGLYLLVRQLIFTTNRRI